MKLYCTKKEFEIMWYVHMSMYSTFKVKNILNIVLCNCASGLTLVSELKSWSHGIHLFEYGVTIFVSISSFIKFTWYEGRLMS